MDVSAPKAPRGTGAELAKLRKELNAIRAKFWRHEAATNPGKYSAEQLGDMAKGKAPMGVDGEPMEVHHKVLLSRGGTNDFGNLRAMTFTDHRAGANFKLNHPTLTGAKK